jgi:hypothetical protein
VRCFQAGIASPFQRPKVARPTQLGVVVSISPQANGSLEDAHDALARRKLGLVEFLAAKMWLESDVVRRSPRIQPHTSSWYEKVSREYSSVSKTALVYLYAEMEMPSSAVNGEMMWRPHFRHWKSPASCPLP